MSEKITVVKISASGELGPALEVLEVDNTLKALQKEVGGYIEVAPLSLSYAMVVNEHGKLCGLEYNTPATYIAARHDVWDKIVGTALIVGIDCGDEFISLAEADLKKLTNMLVDSQKLGIRQ